METPFLPAPELIKSYQNTFEKTNQHSAITNTTNYKLKAHFSNPVNQKNSFQTEIGRGEFKDRPIHVENREAIIFEQLRQGQI